MKLNINLYPFVSNESIKQLNLSNFITRRNLQGLIMKKRALISVSDKTGIVEFAKELSRTRL